MFHTIGSAQQALCPEYKTFTPDTGAHAVYERLFPTYRSLYFSMGEPTSKPVAIGAILPALREIAARNHPPRSSSCWAPAARATGLISGRLLGPGRGTTEEAQSGGAVTHDLVPPFSAVDHRSRVEERVGLRLDPAEPTFDLCILTPSEFKSMCTEA